MILSVIFLLFLLFLVVVLFFCYRAARRYVKKKRLEGQEIVTQVLEDGEGELDGCVRNDVAI